MFGPGLPGAVIDNTLPEFAEWPDSFNGLRHLSGNMSIGVTVDEVRTEQQEIYKQRKIVSSQIQKEALRRITLVLPAIDSFAMLEFLALLWPTINTAAAGAQLLLLRDIYTFAKSRLTMVATATLEQLQAYDVVNDAWPS